MLVSAHVEPSRPMANALMSSAAKPNGFRPT